MVLHYESYCDDIIKLARKAGDMLLAEYKKSNVVASTSKGRHEILTETDLKAEKIILTHLEKYYPAISILSEEAGQVGTRENNTYWVVDPLDGTTNYAMHNPLWAVSLALIHNDQPVLAVTYAPFLREMYHAVHGGGAFLNNQPLQVSKIAKLDQATLTFCYGYNAEAATQAVKIQQSLMPRLRTIRQMGSAALELAYVAAGRAEAYYIASINPWDIAPGALLVREAGGVVTNIAGIEWNIKDKNILATNKKLHTAFLRNIRKLGH